VAKPDQLLLCEKLGETTGKCFTVLPTAELLEGIETLTELDDEDWSLYCCKSENASRT